MKIYLVKYTKYGYRFDWICEADDSDRAVEQLKDAYSECVVEDVYECKRLRFKPKWKNYKPL